MDESLADLRLAALVAPGTAFERQARLVEIARRMGFKIAREAYWDEAYPEAPMDNIDEGAENGGVGEVYPVEIGIFLGGMVYTVCRWADGCGGDEGGEIEYGHFDTPEEAEAWAANDKKVEEGK